MDDIKLSPWEADQELRGVCGLNRTYLVRMPAEGDIVEVNRFDMNLAVSLERVRPVDRLIQVSDTSWIRPGKLTKLSPDEERVYVTSNSRHATEFELATN